MLINSSQTEGQSAEQLEVQRNEIRRSFIRAQSILPSIKEGINKQIEHKKKELENFAFEQDIKLKKITLFILFGFLLAETVAIFIFSYLQGVEFHNFKLEEWSFKLLVSATIAQITYMVQMAVKHLFPKRKQDVVGEYN